MMVLCCLQGGGLMRQAQHGLTVLKDHPDRVRLIRSSARSSAQGMVSSAPYTCLDPCMPAQGVLPATGVLVSAHHVLLAAMPAWVCIQSPVNHLNMHYQ